MSSTFDSNNPLVAAYMARNPTGILSLAAAARNRMKPTTQQTGVNPDLVGSNNSSGYSATRPPSNPMPNPMPNPSNRSMFGFGRPGQSGFYQNGSMNSIMNAMPQYGSNNEGPMIGGTPVSFAAGGMMGPGGGAIRPGNGMMETEGPELGATGEQLTPQEIDHEAQEFIRSHPEEAQKIQEVIALAMQTGELTPEELNTAVQLAKTALASPQSYPQIRQFAIKNGLGTEQDIPQQMDQGLLFVLIAASKAMSPGGNAMQNQAPSPTQQPKPSGVVPEYKDGGMTGDKPHIAKLHAREYVIPEDALIYHGKKHFDKLVEQARTPPDAGTN